MLLSSALAAVLHAPANYSPASDVTVFGICLLIFILLTQTSVSSRKRLRTAILMLLFTAAACLSNMLSMVILSQDTFNIPLVYIMRTVRHVSLSMILFFYISYLDDPLWIPSGMRKRNYIEAISALIVTVIADISLSILGSGYRISPDGEIQSGINVYTYLFVLYLGIVFYRIIRYRRRIIRKIYWCMLFSNIMCIVMMSVQGKHHQTSFTTISFFMPILCLIFMFHSNPYDTDTGALSEKFFYEDLNNALEKKKTMVVISFCMTNFFKIMKDSKPLQHVYREFFRRNFQRGTAYRFTNNRLVYVFPKNAELEHDTSFDKIISDFMENYSKFGIDYKLTIVETTSENTNSQDYMKLIYFAENKMSNNSIYHVTEDDINSYYTNDYILKQLEDINHKKRLDDPRILVYCQPVYNLSTNSYDTAEALMRLQLDRTGIVYPDKFIPLAEQNRLIHTMSLIILNKTCIAINKLIEQGYNIERISVNFSTSDLRYESFCEEIQHIIAANDIPLNKIAIEITESRNDSDFNIIIQKVKQLKELGIKFYLDDFGTGYSNFERIMEIPFDIIKFDRSMLIESSKSKHSFYMVGTFAKMFSKLNYSVLFEGVENDDDEDNCKKMNARYLQGYKYSKPIPIEQLHKFLKKSK